MFYKKRNKFSSQKANENTECYKCGNKGHFAKDYFSKTSEPSYKSPVTGYSLVLKGFQPKFTPKLIQSLQNSSSQAKPKIQKDYKAEYKKIKAKRALLEVNPSKSQTPKTFQPNKKANDGLTVGKNHACNGEWIDITMRKVNILLSMNEDADWKNYLKYINIDLKFVEEINENENPFIPASMGYDHKMVLKSKYWVERLNPDSKLPNFNTRKIIVPESQAVNESLKPTKTLITPESSKDSKAESLIPLPPLQIIQGASPSSEVIPLTFQPTLQKRDQA
ncbi:retrovirus-related pol polyprotein from transposon TNT 1-94 [Tanacetum coccineum]